MNTCSQFVKLSANLLVLIVLVPAWAACQEVAPLPEQKLIWFDEFEVAGLPDAERWSYDTGGHGFGNQELQYYTRKQAKNARIENGRLIVEAHKEAYENNEYTSAKLITRGKGDWTYGRFEIKAKLPAGKGTWPAIWMLSSKNNLKWPDDGEIDIMEHVGFDPGNVHGTIHTKAYNHVLGTQKGGSIMIPDAETAFHVYTIDWTPEKIDWYVDDQKYYTVENTEKTYAAWPFDSNFYLILNIAVGGAWGGQQGVDENIWPQRMEIDYVRVYGNSEK